MKRKKEEEMLYTQYLHADLLVLRLNGERSVEKRRGKALDEQKRETKKTKAEKSQTVFQSWLIIG